MLLIFLNTFSKIFPHNLYSKFKNILKISNYIIIAHVDIAAGKKEMQKLFSLMQGNRGLILKVFSILISFILLSRLS